MFTKKDIRQFLIQHFALDRLDALGQGKAGILSYIARVKCLQEDPLDICGNNVEILLKARFSDYDSSWLEQLLYREKRLVEGFDKEAAIYSAADWANFATVREAAAAGNINALRYRGQTAALEQLDEVRQILQAAKQPISSKDLALGNLGESRWGSKNLGNILLYQLWCAGEVTIAGRVGRRKFYELSTFKNNKNPPENFLKWLILRRLSGLGAYWESNGAGWQGSFFDKRQCILDELITSGEIVKIEVEEMAAPLILTLENYQKLCRQKSVKSDKPSKLSFIAPLDNLIWDRKFVKEIFDFDYSWEVYRPASKRIYGYYVLPILYGDTFIGRIEPSREKSRKNKLEISKIWFEKAVFDNKIIREKIAAELERFNQT